MNQNTDTIPIVLTRDGSHVPWGFRLQGGADFSIPLSVQQVTGCSVAERSGLLASDTILRINGRDVDSLAHDAAKDIILQSGDRVEFLVQRGEMTIWKPKVTPVSNLRPHEIHHVPESGEPAFIQKTSLAADKQVTHEIGSGYNRTAKSFASFVGGTPTHSDNFNQADSSSHSYAQYGQNTGNSTYASGCEGQAGPAIRSVKAPVFDPAYHQETQQTHQMVCKICGRLIIGVFVKIKGDPLHPECFKCFTCGKNLKNQGHYYVQDKMYCEIHAREATNS